MSQILGRFHRHTQAAQDAQHLTQHVIQQGNTIDPNTPTQATAGGDERKLRGIPAIGRGVTGAIAGTTPHQHA